jgi:hypothetical protein
MTNDTLIIRAIRSCATVAEAKEILVERRRTVLALEDKYGPDHPTAKMFSNDYWAASDELVAMVTDGLIAK